MSSGITHIFSSHETQSIKCDSMIWANPQDVILEADEVTIIICLLYTFFLTLF